MADLMVSCRNRKNRRLTSQRKTARMSKRDRGWVEIRTKNGRLLFKFHKRKNLIEQKRGGTIHVVDLDDGTVTERPAATYRPPQMRNLGRMAY